jgi:HlyD family secretion protein
MSHAMDRPVSTPHWRRRPALISLAALAVAASAGLMASAILRASTSSVRVPEATVTIDPVERGVFHDFVALKATAIPRDQVYLDALEGGQVAEVLAHPGDAVAAGQPLVKFRNTELELDVLDREGRLVESITQLQAYEKQLDDSQVAGDKAAAEIDYNIVRLARSAERRDRLLSKGFVPREQSDLVHDELAYDQRLKPLQEASNRQQAALRSAQLPQIHAELASLRQSLAITRSKLDTLTLRAPVAGKLTGTDLEVGQIRKPGDRLGEIVPATGFKVRAEIDEYYLGRVRTGQQGDVEIDGKRYGLTVTRVDPQVKDATFRVELNFTGAQPPGLLPGEALEGKLAVGGDRPALILPAGPFLERSGGDWAMVAAPGGGHADKRRIRLGARNADQVEVLSGLSPGERVITSDYAAFEKVQRVDLTR